MFKPWFLIPAPWAHKIAPLFLPALSTLFSVSEEQNGWRPVGFRELRFPNPLGLAGGVDKEGGQLLSWQRLGCGFVEVGTITPRAQGPNPGKIIDRFVKKKALWNKMGFPNEGADLALAKLQEVRPKLKIPLFINIGKNRDTNQQKAIDDYVEVTNKLYQFADAFVVNVSSPNTRGLRDLQTEAWLTELFNRLAKVNPKRVPILLKLSPDLTSESLKSLMTSAHQAGCAGFILTNTTLSREPNSAYPADGGLSGLPVQRLSEQALSLAIELFGPKQPQRPLIVSVGGVLSAEDVEKRLELGADLVQCYSALVLEGPLFFKKVAKICDRKK